MVSTRKICSDSEMNNLDDIYYLNSEVLFESGAWKSNGSYFEEPVA